LALSPFAICRTVHLRRRKQLAHRQLPAISQYSLVLRKRSIVPFHLQELLPSQYGHLAGTAAHPLMGKKEISISPPK
jgi:hypothetical protein